MARPAHSLRVPHDGPLKSVQPRGLTSAAQGRHFASRGNRFWRAIHLAGFTREEISPEHGKSILAEGCGLTTAVARPTSRADELSQDEFVRAAAALSAKIAHYTPNYVAFLGKAAFAAIFARKLVEWIPLAQPILAIPPLKG